MKKQTTAIAKSFEKVGRSRVIIENITPEVEGGLYPAKRVEGEWMVVEADVFMDGHDHLGAVLMHRKKGERKWNDVRMTSMGNDRWQGFFQLEGMGYYEYAVRGYVDHAETWQYAFRRRMTAPDVVEMDVQLRMGIQLLEAIAARFSKTKAAVKKWIALLESENAFEYAASLELEAFFKANAVEDFATISEKTLEVVAHRKRAGFSAWYSFFPRSAAPQGKAHGTFHDCEALLPRIKEMGFDVVYLPPIHPIGDAFKKGKNNTLNAGPEEPGCPYAIGNKDGGHKAILKELGTLADFKRLVKKTESMGMEIALDFAIQCSPDHPYVKEHPQWFKWRPDGTVQYAENPPKKYQDVLPLDYENEDWQNMWIELKSILEYWIEQGVKIFRVDNPHTKSFMFWQWCLSEIEKTNPEVIFLSEAFTKPRVMENLAKKGYHQSYTYYTWRNSKVELMQYMNELTHSPMREYFRPNFWPNTHDINPYITQSGHEPQFLIRYMMCATLSSNYGIFGPSYELLVNAAIPGKEEYLDSEKYEVRHWDWSARNKLMHVIGMVNKIRNENEAFQYTNNYVETHTSNDQLFAFTKVYGQNKFVCIVNLDAYSKQSGTVYIPLQALGLHQGQGFIVHDLISGDQYHWSGSENFVELDPHRLPFHIFRIE